MLPNSVFDMPLDGTLRTRAVPPARSGHGKSLCRQQNIDVILILANTRVLLDLFPSLK